MAYPDPEDEEIGVVKEVKGWMSARISCLLWQLQRDVKNW
jgi:hypothetical protein